MSDADDLYRHLSATAELPVERRASRLLGEAEAVAEDLRGADPGVQAERAAIVLELLRKIDETGSTEADEHVERARELAERLTSEE